MKHYNQPETNVLQVVNSSIICASVGAVTGQLKQMENAKGAW